MTACFLRIDGANGASFFFSTTCFADWKKSLEFYQGISCSAKLKKLLLTLGFPLAAVKAGLSAKVVAEALKEFLPPGTDVTISPHDSAMISPTRDKVIIHHHNRCYEKFAVGESYAGVKRELELYQLLQESPPRHFVCSKLGNFSCNDKLVRFEMYYAPPHNPSSELPLASLAEFFGLKKTMEASWRSMWSRLKLPFEVPESDLSGVTPVGTVHRDFKPWNVKTGRKPQFFDFESVADGLPLEDFFNYAVAPSLSFGSPANCLNMIRNHKVFESASRLLDFLGIDQREVCRYWRWYLLERYDFFIRSGNTQLANKFLELYEISSRH